MIQKEFRLFKFLNSIGYLKFWGGKKGALNINEWYDSLRDKLPGRCKRSE